MKSVFIVAEMLCTISICWAQSSGAPARIEAEYYVTTYAKHYRVPIALARAIVVRESNWQPCVISPKGAMGLMQLMPATAKRLGVTDRCNLDQNVSGGQRLKDGAVVFGLTRRSIRSRPSEQVLAPTAMAMAIATAIRLPH